MSNNIYRRNTKYLNRVFLLHFLTAGIRTESKIGNVGLTAQHTPQLVRVQFSAPTLETLWCLRSIFGKKVLRR
jgi:hypothetical protein